MNYRLTKNYQDTWYYEFCPGKYDSNDPKHTSVYISSDAMELIVDCVHRANNNYEFHQITEFTKEKGQIQLLAEELKMRLTEINNTMIVDLINWLENLKENELSIIPPFDKFVDVVLGPE